MTDMQSIIISRAGFITGPGFKSQDVLSQIKGALDKYNIIPQLFPKKKSWDFDTIRSVGMGND